MKRLYILIPIFNESVNIPILLDSLRSLAKTIRSEFICQIVIVDDGSCDGSVSRIEREKRDLSILVLVNGSNRGPGFCFGRAFQSIKSEISFEDWVITMEGDNTSSIETIRQMLVRKNEGYDVVLASPYAYGGGFANVSGWRVLVSRIGHSLCRIILDLRGLNTYSSFVRLYSGSILHHLYEWYGPMVIECSGFECMVELLYKLVLLKARISEVEMKMDWSQRCGKSKMKTLKAIRGYFRVLLRKNKWARKI